jgi:acylphosphatase
VSGFVRNLSDGNVEVCAWGALPALEALELALARGPGGARVEYVDKQDIPHDIERLNSFEIR